MTQEKKKLRFTCIDFFVLILILVVGVAFFAKGYLASLIRNEQELVAIDYTLSMEGTADTLSPGDALSTSSGRSLGTVTAVRTEGEKLFCDVQGYAGTGADGYVISADTVLRQGESLTVCWENGQATGTILEISRS